MGTTTDHDVTVATAGPTRREVLVGAGVLAGVGVLAACGTSEPDGGTTTAPAGDAPADSAAIARLADIPVGGAIGATLAGRPVLLTRPEAGTVVAVSAICTHQQCQVLPDEGRLLCPCHGSVYGLDGSNVSGPAPSPLTPVEVHVSGEDVLAGAG